MDRLSVDSEQDNSNDIAAESDRTELQNPNENDDSEDDNVIADQLLNIRKGGHEFDSGAKDTNPNIIQVYEPKALLIWKAYLAAFSPQKQVGCSSHMMITCLLHIVDFCCWARSTENILNWITTEIFENSDLRPRVRNGLTLLFVYCVAAAKADVEGNTDMFTVMQDCDSGLGIVNRTSLKIYNDNLNYFSFLKMCLSGLITAGMVPENERSNQVRNSDDLVNS
jgi:hypothetical protein